MILKIYDDMCAEKHKTKKEMANELGITPFTLIIIT